MAKFLFDIQEKNHLQQKGLLKRFNMKCIGKQPTMEEIRSEKNKLYNELKTKRNTRDYEMIFLRYIPKQKKEGSQLGFEKQGDIVESEEMDEMKPIKNKRKNKTKKKDKNIFLQLFNKNKKSKHKNKTKKSRKDYLY